MRMNFTPPHSKAIRLKDNHIGSTASTRDSNIELLRLVAMFSIVLLHLTINGTSFYSPDAAIKDHCIANTIVGFTYVGVNCFILISGFFGIKFSWRSLLNLYFVCFTYELVGLVAALFYRPDFQIHPSDIGSLFFPLSHSSLWYIRCYVVLLFLSPILNAGLNAREKNSYQHVLILLTILNLYFGWFWKNTDYNGDGYNISQFIFLYVIGGYLHRYIQPEWICSKRYYFLCGYILLSLLWGITQDFHVFGHNIPHWNGWSYSNPIVILSAICLFLFFRSISFHSRIVNFIAKGTLAVYVLHCNCNIGGILYQFTRTIIENYSIGIQVLILIVIAFLLTILVSSMDAIRSSSTHFLLTNRLTSYATKFGGHATERGTN